MTRSRSLGAMLPDVGARTAASASLPFRSAQTAVADVAVRLSPYGEGLAAGRAQAEIAHRLEMIREREAGAQAWAASRMVWVEEQAARLDGGLADGLAQLEAALASAVERALMPFLARHVRDAAVAQLVAQIRGLLGDGDATVIHVAGPADLVGRLGERLGGGQAVRVSVSEACDITVRIDDTLVQTRIAAWLTHLEATP